MAAPEGIVWGSTVGDYGKIGIYRALSSTSTQTTVTVEVWFWSKFSVRDDNNTFFYDNLASAGSATTSRGKVSINTTSDTGGWSTDNQKRLGSYNHTYNRGNSNVTRYLYAAFKSIDRVGGTMYANTTFVIPKLPTYTIAYNANGGSGAPSSQTKTHGATLTLSSTKPTRTGYSFKGWALTKAEADAGTWYYQPGGSCGKNSNLTLYAVWEPNTYEVKYNANGGSGAPSSQTKTYGVPLSLSGTKPTRTNYTFKGWGTSASSTTVTYNPGASYARNAAITLYAIWELNYANPRISNVSVTRCVQNGTASDSGTYARVKFNWGCDRTISSIVIEWEDSSGVGNSTTIAASGTSGAANQIVGGGSLNAEKTYKFRIKVQDSVDYSITTVSLYGEEYIIDLLTGGKGVAFGKVAEKSGYAEFGFNAMFHGSVQGNVLGLSTLPQINADADFDAYLEPGVYGVGSHSIAGTIKNNPAGAQAGRLIVCAATGGGYGVGDWTYLQQWYIPMTFTASGQNAFYVRTITRSPNESPNYYSWLKFTGTNA